MDVSTTSIFINNIDTKSEGEVELYYFLKNNLYIDAHINIQSKKIPCHKIILASASSYFRSLLSYSKDIDTEINLMIPSEWFDIVIKIVDFFYGVNVEILDDEIISVIVISEMFQLENLLSQLCKKLIDFINISNALPILIVVDQLQSTSCLTLRTYLMQYVRDHFEELLSLKSRLLELSLLPHSTLSELISNNKMIFANSESFVVETIINYYEINYFSRMHRLELTIQLQYWLKFKASLNTLPYYENESLNSPIIVEKIEKMSLFDDIAWDQINLENLENTEQKIRKIFGESIINNVLNCLSQKYISPNRIWYSNKSLNIPKISQVNDFQAHSRSVIQAIAITDNYIFTGSLDGVINVWRLTDFGNIFVIGIHEGPIWCLQASKHYLFSGGHDSKIGVIDIKNFRVVTMLEGHTEPVGSISIINNFESKLLNHSVCRLMSEQDQKGILCRIASGSDDKTIRIWGMWIPVPLTGKRVFSQMEEIDTTNYTVSNNHLLHPQKWICEQILIKHKGWVNSLFYSKEFNFLASGSRDSLVLIWNMQKIENEPNNSLTKEKFEIKCHLSNHKRIVRNINIFKNYLITSSSDCTIKLWDILNGFQCTFEYVITEVGTIFSSVVIGPYLISACNVGFYKIFNLESRLPVLELRRKNNGVVQNLVFDNQTLNHYASGALSTNYHAIVEDLANIDHETIHQHQEFILLTGHSDGKVVVWKDKIFSK